MTMSDILSNHIIYHVLTFVYIRNYPSETAHLVAIYAKVT